MQDKEEKRKQWVKTAQMGLWVALILIQMTAVHCLEVKAEDTGEYRYRQIEKDVVYEHVEANASVPETLDIQIREDGQIFTAACSAKETAVLREWWEDGFSIPITFHLYDADYYRLGDRLVPHNGESPELYGYEDYLLELIGAPPEEYQITALQWAGEPYLSEEGELCREALGTGRKLLRDYRVRYAGMVQIPVQSDIQEQTEAEPEESEALEMTEGSKAGETAGPQVKILEDDHGDAETETPLTLWQRITRSLLIAIGIGALFFFGGLLILAFLWVEKKLRKWYTERKS